MGLDWREFPYIAGNQDYYQKERIKSEKQRKILYQSGDIVLAQDNLRGLFLINFNKT